MNRFTRQDSSWFLYAIYAFTILFSIFPFITTYAVENEKVKEEVKATEKAVITVPDDYRTIQEGINAAKSGDKVRIRIGTYKETLQMKDGIILIGEDTEKVVVQCDAKKESVINITNCQTGSISKITFEHTGKDNTPKRRMNVFDIKNSSVAVRDCIIKNGSGHGIGIEEDSRPIIINCAVKNNGWTGIYVKGKKANPILKWNLCMNNKNYGISFVESQGGLAEGNKVEKNGWSGICVYGEGATAILKGNKCKGNERSGINIFKKANATIEGNISTANAYDGIAIEGSGEDFIIKANECNANFRCGISVAEGTKGTIVENTCEKNKQCGIGVIGKNTRTKVIGNICKKNRLSGIHFKDMAEGSIESNICDDNEDSGIAVSGEGTEPIIKKNKCSNNALWGIAVWDNGIPKILPGNITVGNGKGGISNE